MYSNNLDSVFIGGMLIFALIVLAVAIFIAVLYLLNLQNLLKEISPSNREVEPSNVWLMFIPLFNMIYPFILYPKISDSVKKEYAERGIAKGGDFGRSIGITMPILGLCGWIPFLGGLAGLANLILFIIFWVKMAEYKNELIATKRVGGFSTSTDLLD
ncbi:hypothetical protein D3C87_24890 [compost metagenome]